MSHVPRAIGIIRYRHHLTGISMANLVRLAKSGSDWKSKELVAYHIAIQEHDQAQFFGGPLPEYAGPIGFIEHEDRVQGIEYL